MNIVIIIFMTMYLALTCMNTVSCYYLLGSFKQQHVICLVLLKQKKQTTHRA